MACDDGIIPHNFRLGVDTALLSTCSTFCTALSEMAVVLRRKTSVGIIDQMGAAALLDIPTILHLSCLFLLSGCPSSHELELKDSFPTIGSIVTGPPIAE